MKMTTSALESMYLFSVTLFPSEFLSAMSVTFLASCTPAGKPVHSPAEKGIAGDKPGAASTTPITLNQQYGIMNPASRNVQQWTRFDLDGLVINGFEPAREWPRHFLLP